MTDLIEYGDSTVAVGWNRIGCCDGGKAIAWRSTDGVTWEVLPTDGTAFEPHHFPSHLATAPDGSLVLASHTGLGSAWMTLTTRDLRTWERHEVTAPDALASTADLAVSPSTLVAVGTHIVPGTEPERFQRVWLSSDGRTWRDVDPPARNGSLTGVAWDAPHRQFIAVGQDADGRPAVWRSTDGQSWAGSLAFDERPGTMSGIAAVDGLVVATGSIGPEGAELIAWSSHDGVTWQIAELGPSHFGQAIVGTGNGWAVILLHGTTGEPEYRDVALVWAGER